MGVGVIQAVYCHQYTCNFFPMVETYFNFPSVFVVVFTFSCIILMGFENIIIYIIFTHARTPVTSVAIPPLSRQGRDPASMALCRTLISFPGVSLPFRVTQSLPAHCQLYPRVYSPRLHPSFYPGRVNINKLKVKCSDAPFQYLSQEMKAMQSWPFESCLAEIYNIHFCCQQTN